MLQHLEAVAFAGAPRFIRIDADREVLTFIPGSVPRYHEKGSVTTTGLSSLGVLLRSLDDALDGLACPEGAHGKRWRHGDASVGNCVFRGDTAIAFIDFDYVRPLPPWCDLHRCAWQSVPLADPESCAAMGVPPADLLARLISFVSGYGAREQDMADFMLRVGECAQDLIDTWQGDHVVPTIVERQVAWIHANASRFDDALAASAVARPTDR